MPQWCRMQSFGWKLRPASSVGRLCDWSVLLCRIVSVHSHLQMVLMEQKGSVPVAWFALNMV